jgi:DNA primase small subunit
MSTNTNVLNVSFLQDLFRRYYYSDSNIIPTPRSIEKHEFGYTLFNSAMIRHLSFANRGELIARLVKEAPLDVFCSNSYYSFPMNSLQTKGWQGADLIFDIDLKDLNTACASKHSFYVCNACGACYTSSVTPCSSCSESNFSSTSIPCNRCLLSLKTETRRLIEFLKQDLGILDENIEIFFSGNAGYHIHVDDPLFRELDSSSRADIVDYISGNGLLIDSFGVRKFKNGFQVKYPKSGILFGWRKRIAVDFGFNQVQVSKLTKIVESNGGYNGFKEKVTSTARYLGIRIDPQVTRDVHRIFRLASSINGKSSLIKAKVEDLESFNPFNSACVLGDEQVYIRSKVKVKIELNGRIFRIRDTVERLPAFVAAYLISKKLADFVK